MTDPTGGGDGADSPRWPERGLQAALARQAYDRDRVRLTGAAFADGDCLVATRQGLFAVGRAGTVAKLAHGFFFGIRAVDDAVYAFEACDRPYARSRVGRLIRMRRDRRRLVDPTILAKGLDNQCHQLAVFDGSVWLVDTANQAILQFALDGTPHGAHMPFPAAPREATDGTYLHLNALAMVGGRIALMLHNGAAGRPSELAWLDRDWIVRSRSPLAGHGCHDIVADEDGVLWHCASQTGEVITSAGARYAVTDRMTRGLAVTRETIVVGTSAFGTRETRDALDGSIIFLDRATGDRTEVPLPGAPTDLILS